MTEPKPQTLILLAAVLLASNGCNTDRGLQTNSSSSSGSGSTVTSRSSGPEDSVGATTDGATTFATTGSTSETNSGSTGGSSSSSETGGGHSACGPRGPLRTATVQLGRGIPDATGWENVDATCFVGGMERGGGSSDYRLECDEGEPEPTVRMVSAPFIAALELGMTVRLRYLRQHVTDGRFYFAFAIHDLEDRLVMGNYQNQLPNSAPLDPATFFAPFEFESVDGLCPTERPVDDGGGAFISNPCPFARTSLGIRITAGDEDSTIVDGAAGSVSGYEFNIAAFFVDFVDPNSECGLDRELISIHVFSEAA